MHLEIDNMFHVSFFSFRRNLNKTKPSYMKMLKHLLNESDGFTLDISHLHLDFEVAVREAACHCWPGPGCSKLMMLLVNISLKFQSLISEICQYFLLKR